MPRVQKPQKPRHDPLHVEIEQDSSVRQFGRVKPKRRDGRHEDDEDEVPGVSFIAMVGDKLMIRRAKMLE
jgi:essential nuclear protein 1